MNGKLPLLPIGTMLRLKADGNNDEYIDFMGSCGMECCQVCRLNEDYLKGGVDNAKSQAALQRFAKYSIRPVSIFLCYKAPSDGNGLVTPELRTERFTFAFRQMLWAKRQNIPWISCHAGVFPEPGSQEYSSFVNDMREFADFAADLGQSFLFETGPEPLEVIELLLQDIGKENVGLNFDPANLLLYDKSDPEVFAERLFHKIFLIHCKDGKRPMPGEKLGRETPLGEGDTNFRNLLSALLKRGFRGPLILERETAISKEHFDDQAAAVQMLKEIRKPFVGS